MLKDPPLWRYPWVVVQFLFFIILIKVILQFIGFIVCIPFCWKDSRDWPKFLSIWAHRDGGDPEWWIVRDYHVRIHTWKYKFKHEWSRRYWYSAWRNSVAGFKYLQKDTEKYKTYGTWFDTDMEYKDLKEANVTSAIRWRTYGWRDGIRWVKIYPEERKYREIWFGWKIGSPVPGLGFSSQIRGFPGKNDI